MFEYLKRKIHNNDIILITRNTFFGEFSELMA